ncbi:hypothetical protein GCM10025867_03790 [Frondihabitans sucicola]|uniref:YncI copper-binding domain-containing protein n=1 Tax=Frondihabitans sucicola TaxID=1268041 RepID=A0ABM8GID8_9MICO|nr:YcnI family protein [Frondihabitans sucicola]BDZ48138.1 hypothetical protein GCM10025867_03790 [Frondihabitans sucicola]
MAQKATLTKTVARVAIVLPLAGALALAAPLAASAHVHVVPEQAPAGDYATLQFKVPTESATASTVKLEVDFPTAQPFTSVSYQPLAGWKVDVVQGTLPKPVATADGTISKAVTKVIWTADAGQGIAPGAFQFFTVSAGAVPDTGKVELPATQTYSDGSVVKWNEATPASGDEPEHPAPTLYINDAPRPTPIRASSRRRLPPHRPPRPTAPGPRHRPRRRWRWGWGSAVSASVSSP